MVPVPKAPLVPDDDIERLLANAPGWRRDGAAITKLFAFRDFAEALAFVNRVAQPAEAMNHHPDVSIHWNEVTMTLWTHASGGLTMKDFELARAIDERVEV
jgi:4a-hydroxytetrahydrobiopterin dehydratase